MIRLDRTFWPTLVLLAAVLALFELSSLDLALQDLFFDFQTQRWLVDSTAPLPRLFFYNGPKILIIGVGVILMILACGPSRWRYRFDRRALLVALATLASVPALIGFGKATTDIFCPAEIRRYGGDVAYIQLCASFPATDRPERRGRCFPAGHASGGFALFGLAGLARTRRGQKLGLAIGLLSGSAMGLYQIAKGAHYVSHTLVTMLLAWWLFLLWQRLLRVKPAGLSQPE